jgi:hypothetical protein
MALPHANDAEVARDYRARDASGPQFLAPLTPNLLTFSTPQSRNKWMVPSPAG